MLNSKPVENILFLDIETTSFHQNFKDMDERGQELFIKRFIKEADGNQLAMLKTPKERDAFLEDFYSKKAPIFAEWGKIICISVGSLKKTENNTYQLKSTSFYSDDEKELLNNFKTRLSKILNVGTLSNEKNFNIDPNGFALCAHNGKVFDFPFIAKRMVVNGIELPKMFDFSKAKPWDLHYFVDTKDEWKFGVFDGSVSLDILGYLFGIKSSKEEMDGSEVKNVYYVEKDLKKIEKYCRQDILALARVYLKMKGIDESIEEYN